MTDSLFKQFPYRLKEVRLLPSKGGRFEVTADDTLVYSKAATGRHAEADEVEQAIAALLDPAE